MKIRPAETRDLETLVELTIQTFRPFYVDCVLPLFGDELFGLRHGQWEDDYRAEVPTLHDPDTGRWMAVAENDGEVVGYVA